VFLSPAAFQRRIARLAIVRRLLPGRFKGRVFLVGGALRELALGRTPRDYDFALEDHDDLAVFEAVFGYPSFLLGKKPLQTHRLTSGELSIDLTMLEGGIEDDLLRRDLTINAMAYSIRDGLFLDPVGGLEDIRRRLIRYPREGSLKEDPLRMIKAVRHLASLPGFTILPEVIAAIGANRELIHRTAPERIRYELDLIMLAGRTHKGIMTLAETGLLFQLFPELLPLGEMDREKGLEPAALGHTLAGFRYIDRIRRSYPFTEDERRCAAYGLLFHDLGKAVTFSVDEEKGRIHFFHHERYSRTMAEAIMERLRFSTGDIRSVLRIVENHMRIFLISTRDATEKATRRIVYKMEDLTPTLVFHTLLDLYGSSGGKENASTRQVKARCREILKVYEEYRSEPLPKLVNGRDMLALGFREGPAIGQVLEEIREKQIAGEMTLTDEALEYAREALNRG
jgi:poly(A) polymerase